MSELAITVLQFGLLLLLWILILSIIAAQGRDMMVSRRTRGGAANPAAPAGQAASAEQATVQQALPAAQAAAARRLRGPARGHRSHPGLLTRHARPRPGVHRRPRGRLLLRTPRTPVPAGSRWFIEDLGSTNGTWLGDEQLTRASTVEPGTGSASARPFWS
ncbi:FHA domain-containing protein [Nesterenkonia pannonica]|uniref:FHA domain-containing protein n=1 Tax=Nesterenkonia pannonica TaxID=1548602 RepID=UPI002164A006|nr:FHA domain-containing protein [Nesterenkonia pannonica]